MDVSFDEAKRKLTLEKRGLDFRDAPRVFEGPHFDVIDDSQDYGELRILTYGELDGRSVTVVWTERDKTRRIISMRHVHAEEIERRRRTLD
jgi:hypothetical protein